MLHFAAGSVVGFAAGFFVANELANDAQKKGGRQSRSVVMLFGPPGAGKGTQVRCKVRL